MRIENWVLRIDQIRLCLLWLVLALYCFDNKPGEVVKSAPRSGETGQLFIEGEEEFT
jgi:hypothetical protein